MQTKRNTSFFLIGIFLLMSVLSVPACSGSASDDQDNDTAADGDSDSDADGDGDSDTDSDSDSDADGDGDTDSDSDTDGDGDSDGDSDTDTDADTDTDTDGDTDSDADGDSDSDNDTHDGSDTLNENDNDTDTDSTTDTSGYSADTGNDTGANNDSGNAKNALETWLLTDPAARAPLDEQSFAAIGLTRADAETAESLLWADLAAFITETRQTEVDANIIESEGLSLKYEKVYLGDEPEGGRSLFISMHGGGNTDAATNDSQWQNQIVLAQDYAPEDTLWIAPRAPVDDWNMWFIDEIDAMFDRLITNMIVFEGVNPNKVYLNGYSAGGDGVYQLGPRMADRWAAAAMSAGHPNSSKPHSLRNIGFAIHVGGDDTSYDRNLVAVEWGNLLDEMEAADPDGYPHQVEVHPGLPHWMNLADRPSIPFAQSFTRNTAPSRVVWRQAERTTNRLYWLSMDPADAEFRQIVTATVEGQSIEITHEAESDQQPRVDVPSLTIRVTDAMLDMDAEVTITFEDAVLHEGVIPRTISTIYKTLMEREDPDAMYRGEVTVAL